MSLGVLRWAVLLLACGGAFVLLAGAGVLVYFLRRRKQPPRGFEVLTKE